MCIHTYIHTYTHTYLHTYIYAYMLTYLETHTHTHILQVSQPGAEPDFRSQSDDITTLISRYPGWIIYIYFKKILLLVKKAGLYFRSNLSLCSFGQARGSTTHCPHQPAEGVAVLHVSRCLQLLMVARTDCRALSRAAWDYARTSFGR